MAKKNSASGSMKKVLVLPDMQIYMDKGRIRGIDLATWSSVLQYARSTKWDEVVIIGDFLDMNCISHHNKEKELLKEGQRISLDYKAGNEILDQIQGFPGKPKVTLIEGNHEFRIDRFIEAIPALKGTIEVPIGLRLDERGVKYSRFWSRGEVYKIGKASFIHGRHTNEFHAKKHILEYGTNIFYGHTHDIQSYSYVTRGDNNTKVAQSLGCLCVYNLEYMQGRPSKWQQSISVFWFQPDGNFNHNVIRIFNHSFVGPDGVFYQPRKEDA